MLWYIWGLFPQIFCLFVTFVPLLKFLLFSGSMQKQRWLKWLKWLKWPLFRVTRGGWPFSLTAQPGLAQSEHGRDCEKFPKQTLTLSQLVTLGTVVIWCWSHRPVIGGYSTVHLNILFSLLHCAVVVKVYWHIQQFQFLICQNKNVFPSYQCIRNALAKGMLDQLRRGWFE